MPYRTTSLMIIVAVLVCGLEGCSRSGKKLWPVTGKVAFQGKPVSTGRICFTDMQNAISVGAILGNDGTYAVRMAEGAGLPEGRYQVTVQPPVMDIPPGPNLKPIKIPEYPNIPKKYRSPSTSGLTLTVKDDAGRYDVDMKP
jgi:hypothetical protein